MMLRWRLLATWALRIGVSGVVVFVAYRHRQALGQAARLMGQARLEWLILGIGAIAGVYVCRAVVYSLPLRRLHHTLPCGVLWQTALMSTSLHQLIPAGGASGYAFLTYALSERGVPGGEASLIAIIDTLSYSAALATLVIGSLVYLLASGMVTSGALAVAFAPGIALVAAAGVVYYLQREESRLIDLVIRAERRLASFFGGRWPEAPLRKFMAEYFRAKAIIATDASLFVKMMGFQYLAVCCDAAALYAAFLALGLLPKAWIVFMAFVVSMAGGAVAGVPGGGGSFELIMAAFFTRHGVGQAQAIAAAILYRVVAFWLPAAFTLVLLFRLRRRRQASRKQTSGEHPA